MRHRLRERREQRLAQSLVRAVAELPVEVRQAMLAAVDGEQLIVGAYADRRGRVCPMLAAHRRGARLDVGTFPRAWDAFARARRPRLATERELDILRAILQEGIGGSDTPETAGRSRPAPATAAAAAEGARAGAG